MRMEFVCTLKEIRKDVLNTVLKEEGWDAVV